MPCYRYGVPCYEYGFTGIFGQSFYIKQARKLQDAQAEKLTSLQANKLKS